ncbi:MAG: threonylcarbamoyl-AMP synthase [Psychromonas sp.]|nr:threonylcarbamoyl-AMP synthase [Psychromonas sp.]
MSLILYVHPRNPQDRLISQAVGVLKNNGVIIYPTEAGYAIGCLMNNKRGIDKICQIRELSKKHNFTLMCRHLSEIATFAKVDNQAYRLLKKNTPGPYTFILKSTKYLSKRLMNSSKHTIGVRVPDNVIAFALIKKLGEPLITSSLILPGNKSTEYDPEEIRYNLKDQVDLILDGGYLKDAPTTVIDLSDGEIVIAREGAGNLIPFN